MDCFCKSTWVGGDALNGISYPRVQTTYLNCNAVLLEIIPNTNHKKDLQLSARNPRIYDMTKTQFEELSVFGETPSRNF